MAMVAQMVGSQYSSVTRSQGVLPLGTCRINTSGQSTWQRGSTPAVFVPSTRLKAAQRHHVKRSCTPIVSAITASSSKQKVASVKPNGLVANEPAPSDLAWRWRQIAGENDWEGLLGSSKDTLDLTLRKEILRYGEFTQATYDTFDFDDHSKYCGSSLYNKAKMFDKVGLLNCGYEVSRYLYATSDMDLPAFFAFMKPGFNCYNGAWSMNSNWIGYVAVCTDEKKIKQLGRRDIVIAWRGTVCDSKWADNIKGILHPVDMMHTTPSDKNEPMIEVDARFLSLYTSDKAKSGFNKSSSRTQVLTELKRLLELYEGEELSITVCGHSLGSALATINAYDIAESGLNVSGKTANPVPVTVFSFGGPRVGNDAFRDRVKKLGVKVLRMVNVNDKVPGVPVLLKDHSYFDTARSYVPFVGKEIPDAYVHVGTELQLDNTHSKFLDEGRASNDNVHNMEQYLHLVDGHRAGKPGYIGDRPFELTSNRDLKLVNKRCDYLKHDESCIPKCWWQQEHKGLAYHPVQGWGQPDRELDDIPHPQIKTSVN